jgi:hypothetical protein
VKHLSIVDRGMYSDQQLEQNGQPHKVLCEALTLAYGVFSGLVADVATNYIGCLLTTFICSDEALVNLEWRISLSVRKTHIHKETHYECNGLPFCRFYAFFYHSTGIMLCNSPRVDRRVMLYSESKFRV